VHLATAIQTSKTILESNRVEGASKIAKSISRADKLASKKKISSAQSEVPESDLRSGPAYVERVLVVKGPEILGILWDKAGRCGRVGVMREALSSTFPMRSHPKVVASTLHGRC
jgi:hypothetical protein